MSMFTHIHTHIHAESLLNWNTIHDRSQNKTWKLGNKTSISIFLSEVLRFGVEASPERSRILRIRDLHMFPTRNAPSKQRLHPPQECTAGGRLFLVCKQTLANAIFQFRRATLFGSLITMQQLQCVLGKHSNAACCPCNGPTLGSNQTPVIFARKRKAHTKLDLTPHWIQFNSKLLHTVTQLAATVHCPTLGCPHKATHQSTRGPRNL